MGITQDFYAKCEFLIIRNFNDKFKEIIELKFLKILNSVIRIEKICVDCHSMNN